MTLIGCDLHARMQQVAALDTATGEIQEYQLSHHGEGVERFYAALSPPVTVAVESTGYALWFHALIRQLGHTLVVGDATARRQRRAEPADHSVHQRSRGEVSAVQVHQPPRAHPSPGPVVPFGLGRGPEIVKPYHLPVLQPI